jgi:hypothetical protein
MNGVDIRKRFSELETDRKASEEVWDLLERFVYPIGGGKFFQPLSNEGELDWRRRNIYDDTAILGADTLAASIHGSLTSPAAKWFDHEFKDESVASNTDAIKWLSTCSKICWETIQASNFNLEVAEGYLDLTSFGNFAMSQEPVDDLSWDGINFDAMPLREAYFEEDEEGQPRCFYRLLRWTASRCISRFGRDKVPEVILKAFDSAVTNKFDIVFCVYLDEANKDADTTKILSKEMRPYQSKYILRENAESLGDTGGYYEMPVHFVRWRRAPGSQWGYGPGHLALSTVITLNEMIKLVLESAEKVIDPVSLVQQRGLLSDLDLQPGGKVVVKDVDKSIKAYESSARFDVSAMQVGDLRDMIRRLFHVDQLELKESPAMSATEVMVRYELMNRLLGPTMGRLQTDLLNRVVDQTFMALFRAGELPEMPDVVKQSDGIVGIQYVGPLARAQKSDEVAAMERWVMDIANFSQIYPELRHVVDPIKLALSLSEGLNVPTEILRGDAELKMRIKKDEDAQEQSMNNEMNRQALELNNLGQESGPTGV